MQIKSQTHHDQIDQWDCIQINTPPVHHAQHVDGYHGDRHGNNEGREEIKAKEDEGDDEDRTKDYS